ncbi:MAG TPA: nucleotidyltransferase domain-containing protein [Candidatus Thermoplasmatota archaeon]|nr:nucleotidyltransferase domain-containing protein [Candidatus Thermoplasmatota archaeon]
MSLEAAEKWRAAERAYRPTAERLLWALAPDWAVSGVYEARFDMTKPALQRALDGLVRAGFAESRVRRTSRGRVKEYRARPFSIAWIRRPRFSVAWTATGSVPAGRELLLQVDEGEFRDDLVRVLQAVGASPFAANVRFVVLFGSVAAGEATWKSDLDVIFLVDAAMTATRADLRDRLADPDLGLAHPVRPFFASPSEFVASDGTVYREARMNGIIIAGDLDRGEDVWAAMARYRVTSDS